MFANRPGRPPKLRLSGSPCTCVTADKDRGPWGGCCGQSVSKYVLQWNRFTMVTKTSHPTNGRYKDDFLIIRLFYVIGSSKQRVLNVQRTRLSRRRMIWVPPSPSLPSPVSKIDQRHTGRPRKREQLPDGRGRSLHGEESLILYKSFNTLWVGLHRNII